MSSDHFQPLLYLRPYGPMFKTLEYCRINGDKERERTMGALRDRLLKRADEAKEEALELLADMKGGCKAMLMEVCRGAKTIPLRRAAPSGRPEHK
jgi:hypothetical protein